MILDASQAAVWCAQGGVACLLWRCFQGAGYGAGEISHAIWGLCWYMAVGQNQWYHLGVGEFTTHFSLFLWLDGDVH